MSEVERLIFLARLADEAKRFEDEFEFISELALKKGDDLSIEERNLLNSGCKNWV